VKGEVAKWRSSEMFFEGISLAGSREKTVIRNGKGEKSRALFILSGIDKAKIVIYSFVIKDIE
jgi:hypothetical protein